MGLSPVSAGQPINPGGDLIEDASLSDDGDWLLTGVWNNDFLVPNIQFAALRLYRLSLTDGVQSSRHINMGAVLRNTKFSADSRWLAAGDINGTLRVFDLHQLPDLEVPDVLFAHRSAVGALYFSSDGRWLLSGGADGNVKRWDLRNLRAVPDEFPGLEDPVQDLTASLDGELVVAAAGQTVAVWTTEISQLKWQGCILAGRRLSESEIEQFAVAQPGKEVCRGTGTAMSVTR